MDQLEQIISQALEHRDHGKSVAEILALFPEYQTDLEQVFQVVNKFDTAKADILPDKKLLSTTLDRLEQEEVVTKNNYARYNLRGETQGRSPFVAKLINNFHLCLNWKIIFPAGVVALVAVLFFSAGPRLIASHRRDVAIRNVDLAVNSTIASAEAESASFEEETGDDSLLDSANQAISDFDDINNNL